MGNIKNKIIFAFIFIVVLSTGTVLLVYLVKKSGSAVQEQAASLIELQLAEQEEGDMQPKVEPQKEVTQTMTMDTDYFIIALPPGWEKSSEGETMPLIIADTLEKVTNEKAKEIDFRTNFSINSTTLGKTSLKDYVESVKTSLIQTIPIIEITKEKQTNINGSEAYILEIKSTQNDLNFDTVVAIFAGKDNTVWAFSFNTLDESWPDSQNIFYQIVNSVVMK